jgi:hypothetical protein
VGGIKTRGVSKSEGTSVMRIIDLPIVKSYKTEGKLLATSKTM